MKYLVGKVSSKETSMEMCIVLSIVCEIPLISGPFWVTVEVCVSRRCELFVIEVAQFPPPVSWAENRPISPAARRPHTLAYALL